MRYFTALVTAVLSTCLVLPPGHAESFEDWKRQQQTGFQQSKDEFAAYRRELLAAFEMYRRKTGAVWGDDNVVPDGTTWVSYIDDLGNRSVVDFEAGTIKVEVALPAGKPVDDDRPRRQLEAALLSALQQGVDKRPLQQIAKQPVSVPHGPAVLEGQVGDRGGNAASPDAYRRIAEEAARNARPRQLKGDDGKTRLVYQASLKLVPDHIRRRAIKYQSLVERYAEEQRIPAPVIYAVMETESMFNPTARSSAPAFGLMQLVPGSGARDAYKLLYDKDRVVSDTYLYDPDNNVRLGSAYLHKLYYDYMDGIDDAQSRMLCAIAAYNTGSSNVFRAFAGKYRRSKFGSYAGYKQTALKEINKRSFIEVYEHMRRKLPYQETRDYIRKVTERMPKYVST